MGKECFFKFIFIFIFFIYLFIFFFVMLMTSNELKPEPKKHSLHMQTTPDNGLWKVRKRLGQFR